MRRNGEMTPELRHAAIRFIEMWRHMRSFQDAYPDLCIEVQGRMSGTTSSSSSCVNQISLSHYYEDRILEGICERERLDELMTISQAYSNLMERCWEQLTEVDHVILEPLLDGKLHGYSMNQLMEKLSVSHGGLYLYRDRALRHFWIFSHKSNNKLYCLMFKWGVLYITGMEKRRARWFCLNELEKLSTGLTRFQLPVLVDHQGWKQAAVLPCIMCLISLFTCVLVPLHGQTLQYEVVKVRLRNQTSVIDHVNRVPQKGNGVKSE